MQWILVGSERQVTDWQARQALATSVVRCSPFFPLRWLAQINGSPAAVIDNTVDGRRRRRDFERIEQMHKRHTCVGCQTPQVALSTRVDAFKIAQDHEFATGTHQLRQLAQGCCQPHGRSLRRRNGGPVVPLRKLPEHCKCACFAPARGQNRHGPHAEDGPTDTIARLDGCPDGCPDGSSVGCADG